VSSNKPVNKTQPKMITETHQVSASVYRGPLPDPESFSQYDAVLPGAADRILRLAEKEQEQRHNLEKIQVKADSRDSLLGIISGSVLSALCLIVGAAIAIKVNSAAGAILGSFFGLSGIGSVIATLVSSTRRKR
jgi:uncharacterized membrane protein